MSNSIRLENSKINFETTNGTTNNIYGNASGNELTFGSDNLVSRMTNLDLISLTSIVPDSMMNIYLTNNETQKNISLNMTDNIPLNENKLYINSSNEITVNNNYRAYAFIETIGNYDGARRMNLKNWFAINTRPDLIYLSGTNSNIITIGEGLWEIRSVWQQMSLSSDNNYCYQGIYDETNSVYVGKQTLVMSVIYSSSSGGTDNESVNNIVVTPGNTFTFSIRATRNYKRPDNKYSYIAIERLGDSASETLSIVPIHDFFTSGNLNAQTASHYGWNISTGSSVNTNQGIVCSFWDTTLDDAPTGAVTGLLTNVGSVFAEAYIDVLLSIDYKICFHEIIWYGVSGISGEDQNSNADSVYVYGCNYINNTTPSWIYIGNFNVPVTTGNTLVTSYTYTLDTNSRYYSMYRFVIRSNHDPGPGVTLDYTKLSGIKFNSVSNIQF